MLLKSFFKGTSQDIDRSEMSLIVSSQFLASPVERELTSNGDTPKIGGTQTVA
jgi:hypothetical protein